MRWLTFLAAGVALAWVAGVSSAAVTLPRVISDHMVLQRGVAAPIWGMAAPGEQVRVEFRGQTKSAVADARGAWRINFDPLEVGEPATLTIRAANTLRLADVLVGEVWVGSGQSNMDTDVGDYIAKDAPLRAAAAQDHRQLRLFRSDVGEGWQVASPQAMRFSAQLFYFGVCLNKALDVPVGVMEGAVRGSPTANWISPGTIDSDRGIQGAIANWEKAHPHAAAMRNYEAAYAQWKIDAAAARAAGNAENSLPRAPWKPPAAGETHGPRGDFFEKHIHPMIPFAIRGVLWDQGEGGVNIEGVDMSVAMHALIGQWRHDWGQGNFAFLYVQKPSGTGCALHPDDPLNHGADGLAPPPKEPGQNFASAAGRCDFQRIMLENSNCYMVTTTDLATGVHPINKSGYAMRDSVVALGAVYGKPLEWIGPTMASCKVEGAGVRARFTHVGQGLVIGGEKLQGFAIAGADGHYHWADAKVEGESIILRSPAVRDPVAAEYAWGWNPAWADLFNRDGLPALMFRADCQK